MNISKRNAKYIVDEISKIIGQKINMMDANGIIIASSNPNRIGTFHAAAKQLIDTGADEVVVKNDSEYEGAKSGTNIAINVMGEIVGVIGVTGDYQEVVKYGQIIKKMTEILMLDRYYKEQLDIESRMRERYLDEWMFGDSKNINQQFIERGNAIQVDITIPRRILAVTVLNQNMDDETKVQRIIDSAEKIVHSILKQEKNCIWLKNGGELIYAVNDRQDNGMITLANKVVNEVESQFPVSVCIGIDGRCEGYTLIHNSVLKALKALKTSVRAPKKGIRLYESINMEIFQSELSNHIKEEYIRRIFRGCSLKEIEHWIGILNVFYNEEGSISSTSEKLYIHKNTLQYKLNKIKEQTGYDPRSIRYSSLFYNAIHFYQDVRDTMIYSEK